MCLGFCVHDDKIYYAISGLDQYDLELEDFFSSIQPKIEVILKKYKKRMARCVIDSAVYNFNEIYETVKPDEKRIYGILLNNIGGNCNIKFAYKYTFSNSFNAGKILKYDKKGALTNSSEYRKWSCVERKLIGTINTNNCDIFCTMKTCYFCLPAIDSVYFFGYGSKYHLNVTNVNHVDLCKMRLIELK